MSSLFQYGRYYSSFAFFFAFVPLWNNAKTRRKRRISPVGGGTGGSLWRHLLGEIWILARFFPQSLGGAATKKGGGKRGASPRKFKFRGKKRISGVINLQKWCGCSVRGIPRLIINRAMSAVTRPMTSSGERTDCSILRWVTAPLRRNKSTFPLRRRDRSVFFLVFFFCLDTIRPMFMLLFFFTLRLNSVPSSGEREGSYESQAEAYAMGDVNVNRFA